MLWLSMQYNYFKVYLPRLNRITSHSALALTRRTENGNDCLDQFKHRSHTYSGYAYKRAQSVRKLSIYYGAFKTFLKRKPTFSINVSSVF